MLRIKKVVSRVGRDIVDVTENHTRTVVTMAQNRNGTYHIPQTCRGYNVGPHTRARREILSKIN